ncbi:MAG: zinc-binding dehydrogenase [Dehalococcoidia bacterium]|jgi:L-iditol 2-dehydrogenase|nr:zinc-binding dehydrogenase [Dehalococcoidia bacterium]
MKAYRLTGQRNLDLVDAPDPTPEDGEVVLKVQHSSICGSDVHLNYEPALPEERYPMFYGSPCHEIAGTIVESRKPGFEVGTRAIVLPETAVSAGGHRGGGLADYIASSKVIPLPDYGSTADWVMCQPSGTALYSSRRWGTTDDKRIAIMGQGAIGLSFTNIAANQGAQNVIAIDLLDYRLDMAEKVGATSTINPDRDNVIEAIEEITGGEGVDVVVDASADPDGINQAVQMVNQRGLVIGFSLIPTEEQVIFRHQEWMRKEVFIHPTSSGGSATPTEAIGAMVDLRDRGWMDPAQFTTHRVGWDDIPDAYEMYSHRKDNVIKVVMEINAE